MNLKFLIPVLLTGLFNFSNGQRQAKHYHNSIDDIHNAEQLANFIRPVLDKVHGKSDIADTAMDIKNTGLMDKSNAVFELLCSNGQK